MSWRADVLDTRAAARCGDDVEINRDQLRVVRRTLVRARIRPAWIYRIRIADSLQEKILSSFATR
jgi:hypothetical protein